MNIRSKVKGQKSKVKVKVRVIGLGLGDRVAGVSYAPLSVILIHVCASVEKPPK